MLRSGERLGDYEIVHPLCSGGMATLFRARRRGAAGFARDVAIKVVHPHLAADASFLRMFVEEAHLAVRIHHPNVVQVEELGAEDGNLYLVMELVRGLSLADLMGALVARGQRLPVAQAVRLGIQIAEGLHAAHETRDDHGRPLGVVHRDVKPHNVLVSEQGYAKVIDFGIAKAMGRDRTRTGTIKGTYAYMAPEQALGREVDRRSDVYALGVVLWELLTLRRLFDAPTDLAVLERVREPVVEPPSRHASDVGPALDAAVLAALAPRREDRPPSADAFRRLLCDAMPDASTEGSALLEQLVAELMPEHSHAPRRDLDADLAAAGRGFRRRPEATTLPAQGRTPVRTPASGVTLPASALSSAPPRRSKRALFASLVLATVVSGWLLWRGNGEPHSHEVRVGPVSAVAQPAASVPPSPPPPASESQVGPSSSPSMPLSPAHAVEPHTGTLGPRRARAAAPKATTRAARGAPRSEERRPGTRVIDGVLVHDVAPY